MSDRQNNRGDPEFPPARSPEELYAELTRAAADPKVFAVGLAIAFEHRTLHVPAGLPTTLAMIRQGLADRGKPIGYLWFDKAGLHATPLREWRNSEWARGFLSMAGNDLLAKLRSDTSAGDPGARRRNP